ncbi:hypothetical protein A4R44_05011 [Amycolatopsis sp. M39]|nr:hypothetical protein A4R44_05011 [Amycolatopsis sp. M39]
MFAAFIFSIAFIVLVDVGIATRRDANWWAAWGSWVGGVGSIAAAAAALWIAQQGWTRTQRETQEREASKFAVWVTTDGSEMPVVMAVNTTALPVYDVEIRTRVGDFSHTFLTGTVSPTFNNGMTIPSASRSLGDSVRINVYQRIGQDAYYEHDEDGEEVITRAAVSESIEVIRKIELSVTFRQGKQRWRAEHDGSLIRL